MCNEKYTACGHAHHIFSFPLPNETTIHCSQIHCNGPLIHQNLRGVKKWLRNLKSNYNQNCTGKASVVDIFYQPFTIMNKATNLRRRRANCCCLQMKSYPGLHQ